MFPLNKKTEPVDFGPLGNSLRIFFLRWMSQDVSPKIRVLSDQEHRDKQTEVEVALPLQQTRTSALGASFFFFFLRKGCEQEWHSGGFK